MLIYGLSIFLTSTHLCPQMQNTAYLFRDIPYFCKTVLKGTTLTDADFLCFIYLENIILQTNATSTIKSKNITEIERKAEIKNANEVKSPTKVEKSSGKRSASTTSKKRMVSAT